jgi:SAM-dependent methyltransferase
VHLWRKIAAGLAASSCFHRARDLYAQNQRHWQLPLSKLDKLRIGLFLILSDYAAGKFPPTFHDQQAAYAAEVDYRDKLGGLSQRDAAEAEMRKPFWGAPSLAAFLPNLVRLVQALEAAGVRPPAKVLELGCGGGWMAEMLATIGYDVTGTSISPLDIADARKRIVSLAAKDLRTALCFEVAPMESVSETLGAREHFDAAFVFEALHHAFDWRRAIQSTRVALKPGGWLFVCQEQNLIHTFAAYRVAKLSDTHEIGFSRRELISFLRANGFAPVRSMSQPLHFWIGQHWIAAQRRV